MLSPLGRSAESAVSAGIDWATRKVATPARTTRIRIPAPVAPPEKRRSPTLRAVRRTGVCEVVVTPAPRARGARTGVWGVVLPPAPRARDRRYERWPPRAGRPDGPGRRRTPRATAQ